MKQIGKGANGFDLLVLAGQETSLVCPKCGGADIVISVQYPARGTGPMGRGRMGDTGSVEYSHCNTCHYDSRVGWRGYTLAGKEAIAYVKTQVQ